MRIYNIALIMFPSNNLINYLIKKGNCDFNALSELRSLKARIEELESEIRERDEEVRSLKENAQHKLVNGEDSESIKVSASIVFTQS